MFGNKIKYIIFLMATWILSILYDEYIMTVIFLTVLILPLISLGIHMYIYGKLKVQLLTISHVAGKGEPISLSVQINNSTIFPISNIKIYLTLCNTFSSKVTKYSYSTSVGRTDNAVMNFDINSDYIGNLDISLKQAKLYDYFNVFSINKKIKDDIKVAVLPSFYEVINPDLGCYTELSVESEYYSAIKAGDDPSEVFDIREYREGDKMQKIHWKLSKKQNQLMIKEFSDPINCDLLIFINLTIPPDKDIIVFMDALLESAISLSYSYLINGLVHYLSWYDDKLKLCRRIRIEKEMDLYEAIDSLLLLAPDLTDTDVIMQYAAEFPHEQYTSIYYITGKIGNKQISSLAALRVRRGTIIYVRDVDDIDEDVADIYSKPILEKDTRDILEAMDIRLQSVNVGDLRENIEQLNLI